MIRLNRLASGILRPVRPLAEGRTYTQAIDLALDPFIGLAYSLVFGFLLLLGLALAATVVGLPVLGEVVMITRAAMGLERARARAVVGVGVDAPPSPTMPVGWWSRIKAMLGDRTGWRAVGYTFVLPFSGILGFTASATQGRAGRLVWGAHWRGIPGGHIGGRARPHHRRCVDRPRRRPG